MIKIKICGITSLDDAVHAAREGADALGFIFYRKSPRYIEPMKAGEIIAALPPFVTPVGVFVDAAEQDVRDAVYKSGVRLLQFHGAESPGYCASFGLPYVKAFRVAGPESLEDAGGYGAAAYLLDTYSASAHGGTGTTFNWEFAASARKIGRVILAGGLNCDNVRKAIETVRPYAVDVSSGVESSPGVKDRHAVSRFIESARACCGEEE